MTDENLVPADPARMMQGVWPKEGGNETVAMDADDPAWNAVPAEPEPGIAEGVRIMGRRDGRYGLDNAADTGLVGSAYAKAYREAYAEGAAHPVDVTRDAEPE